MQYILATPYQHSKVSLLRQNQSQDQTPKQCLALMYLTEYAREISRPNATLHLILSHKTYTS